MTVELVRDAKPWWHDHIEVHALLRWLVDTGRILTLSEAVDYVEKPGKYSPEREKMLREEARELLADEDEAFTELERRRGL